MKTNRRLPAHAAAHLSALTLMVSLALAPPSAASAQTPETASCDTPVLDSRIRELIEENAPQLRFGPGEMDFPTVPFHTAFDAVDNDGDGLVDFADPDEVAPLPEDGNGNRASWSELYRLYQEERALLPRMRWDDQSGEPPLLAVFYRCRWVPESDLAVMGNFLRSDDQAWRRSGFKDVWLRWRESGGPMLVIQYYFYYLNDRGMEGHEGDIEFVFLFLPMSPVETEFRITVGAGHAVRNPNNVLVEWDEISSPVSVMVELGGHASAPDWGADGVFQAGLDANWHATNVWGTRDVLAVTGEGFTGDYRRAQTLARDHALILPWRGPRGGDGYRLLPVRPFAVLDTALRSAAEEGGDGDSGARDQEVLKALRTIAAETQLEFELPDRLSPTVRERLQLWREDLCCGEDGKDVGKSKHRIWDHLHYRRRSSAILKAHLYRPTTSSRLGLKGTLGLVGLSSAYAAGGLWGQHATFTVPVVEPLAGVPLLNKFVVRVPGFLTLQAGQSRVRNRGEPSREGFSAAVVYDRSFREYFSWFTAVRFVQDRWADPIFDEDGLPTGQHRLSNGWDVSAGASLLLWSWGNWKWWFPVRFLRVRVGPRLRLDRPGSFFAVSPMEIEIQVR